jgi:hypothetical protein
LEISTNGGVTWTDMQANIYSGGYTTLMDTSTVLKNRRAWSGTSGNKFIRSKVRLTPFANQSIKFRFRFTSDNGTAAEGWYVDNIAIRSQALIDIQSNLFSATNLRAATVDTFAIIVPVSLCTPSSTTLTPLSICNSYSWNGVTYTTSGIKTWTGTNAAGCDSIVTLSLTINQATVSTTPMTSCSSYTWNGITYTTSGTKSWTGTNAAGCDSTAILNLTINQPGVPAFNQVSPVCINSSFSLPTTSTDGITGSWSPAPNNQTTTTYTFTPNAGQCALSTTMTVTVNASPTVPTFTQVAAICKNGTFTLPTTSLQGVSGTWAPSINNQTTTTYTFSPATGACATSTIMTVDVKQPSSSVASPVTTCSSYIWNGVTYTTSGIKTWTGTNAVGCDSVVTLNLTINLATSSASSMTSCSSYTWNGITYTTSGTKSWTGTNAAGCDSIATLNLTINQPVIPTFTQQAPICINSSFSLPTTSNDNISGTWSPALNNQTTTTYTFTPAVGTCATTTTMTVTVNTTPTAPTFNQVVAICKNGTFTLPTISLEGVSGTWAPAINNQTTTTYTFTPAAGACATPTTITVEVKQPSSFVASPVTACSSYTWNGVTYTTSGIKTWTGTNALGCDSTVSIIMVIYSASVSNSSTSACSTYDWNGLTYTTSGTYTWMGTNSVGCDSTATLNLTINQPTASSTSISNCVSYNWNGVTYTTSGSYTKSGLINSAGCDSTAVLNLTIKQATTSTNSASNCVSYTWNGTTYSNSGLYTKLLTNAAGCDSTAILNLTIKQPTTSSTSISNCVSYAWNGITYTSSETYSKIFTGGNAEGCDSIAILNLIIKQKSTSTLNVSICSTAIPYSWNGVDYSSSGTYSKIFIGGNAASCDSTATLNLTINQPKDYDTSIISSAPFYWTWFTNGIVQTYNQSGVYKDSTCGKKVLRLTLTSNAVYPNPNNGLFNVNLLALNNNLTNNLISNKNVIITVYDAVGKKVLTQKLLDVITNISIRNCSGGIYFIKIQSADKSINYSTKIFKTN